MAGGGVLVEGDITAASLLTTSKRAGQCKLPKWDQGGAPATRFSSILTYPGGLLCYIRSPSIWQQEGQGPANLAGGS